MHVVQSAMGKASKVFFPGMEVETAATTSASKSVQNRHHRVGASHRRVMSQPDETRVRSQSTHTTSISLIFWVKVPTVIIQRPAPDLCSSPYLEANKFLEEKNANKQVSSSQNNSLFSRAPLRSIKICFSEKDLDMKFYLFPPFLPAQEDEWIMFGENFLIMQRIY